MTDFHGYTICKANYDTDEQLVFDPRWPDRPVMWTETTQQAKDWIIDYRAGRKWATDAAMKYFVEHQAVS